MFTPDLITFTPPLPLPAAHLRPGPPYPAYEYTSTYSSSSLLPYSSPCPRSRFSAYSSSPADSQEADEEDEAEPQTEVDDDESSPVPHATQQRIQQQQQQQDVVKPEPEQMAPAGVNPVHKNPPRTRAARATKRQPGQPGNRARVHQRRRPYPQWYYPHFPISFERSGARPREAAPRLEQGRVEQVEVEVEMEVVGSSPPLPFCHRDSDTSPLTSRTLLYFAEEGVQEMEDMVDGDVNADDDDDDDDKAHGDDGHSRTQCQCHFLFPFTTEQTNTGASYNNSSMITTPPPPPPPPPHHHHHYHHHHHQLLIFYLGALYLSLVISQHLGLNLLPCCLALWAPVVVVVGRNLGACVGALGVLGLCVVERVGVGVLGLGVEGVEMMVEVLVGGKGGLGMGEDERDEEEGEKVWWR